MKCNLGLAASGTGPGGALAVRAGKITIWLESLNGEPEYLS
jgi:hypothetical protein